MTQYHSWCFLFSSKNPFKSEFGFEHCYVSGFSFIKTFPHRKHFKVVFKSSLTRLGSEKQAEEGLASSDLPSCALPAGQTSGEDFVIWKCLTVHLVACGGRLLSLQGLNTILSKPDNPGKASQRVLVAHSQAPKRSPQGISSQNLIRRLACRFLCGLQPLCSCKIICSHHFF